MTDAEELELLELERERAGVGQAPPAANPAPVEDVGYGESLLRGGAQTALVGLPDEMAGVVGAGKEAIKNLSTRDLVKNYVANRDAYRARDAQAERANPKTFMAGELAGTLPALAIPGAGTVRGAATAGALLGGATGIGQSTSDLTKGDVGGVAYDAAKGAAIGGTLGAAAKYGADKIKSAFGPRSVPEPQVTQEIRTSSVVDATGKPYTYGENVLVSPGSPPKSKLPGYAGMVTRRASEAAGAGLGHMAGKASGLYGLSEVGGYQAGKAVGKRLGDTVEKGVEKVIQKAPEINLEAIAARLQANPVTSRFLGVLQKAADNGQASLAATHFILSQTEPEYQKATQGE